MSDGAQLTGPDGRGIRFYDTGAGATAAGTPVLLWHHGTPQTGRIIAPLAEAGAARGLRVVSVARAGYEGSTRLLGRSVADAARDVVAVLARLGVERAISVGQSGGATHALAVAALSSERVCGVLSLSAVAPYWDGPDPHGAGWFDGMHDPGALRAARAGRHQRTAFAETAGFDEAMFTARDWRLLEGPWGALGADAGRAEASGPDGAIDDDLAYASPWGVEPADVVTPTILVHGDADRVVPVAHGRALARAIPHADYRELPGEGHLSPLAGFEACLDELLARL